MSVCNVINKPILDVDWYIQVINSFDNNQKELIKKFQLDISSDNLVFQAFSSLYLKKVDALVLGHTYTSKIVFMYSILFFGQNKKMSTAFITNQNQIWTDCALNINPNLDLYNAIINNSVQLYKKLNLYKIPNIALLSYSSNELSNDVNVKKIFDLKNTFASTNVNLIGPIQFDAVVNKEVYFKKMNQKENVNFDILVFPELNSANISYKIFNQLLHIEFYGPFILGIDYKISDLSRSATTNEIIQTIKYLMCF